MRFWICFAAFWVILQIWVTDGSLWWLPTVMTIGTFTLLYLTGYLFAQVKGDVSIESVAQHELARHGDSSFSPQLSKPMRFEPLHWHCGSPMLRIAVHLSTLIPPRSGATWKWGSRRGGTILGCPRCGYITPITKEIRIPTLMSGCSSVPCDKSPSDDLPWTLPRSTDIKRSW